MTQAIFLSYASQDGDAARHICEALRAAGLEVWFDQNELAGGDAWDQKIRRQIKECSLFIPIISEATNAREEGYFRREWNIAVDRMMDMADHKAFLFPVILDSVSEASAVVPEKFRERQWTRLNDDGAIKAFAERIAKLACRSAPSSKNASSRTLDGEFVGSSDGLRSGALADSMVASEIRSSQPPAKTSSPASRRAFVIGAGGAALVAAGTSWWALGRFTAKATTWLNDPQLAQAYAIVDSLEVTRPEVELAEEMVKAVLARRPTDTDAIVVMARIQSYMLIRGFDRTEDRFRIAKQFVDRALILAPENPVALGSAAYYFQMRRTEFERGASLARKAIEVAPDDPIGYRALTAVLAAMPNTPPQDIIASAKKTADKFPNDALAQYDVGRWYRDTGSIDEAQKYFAVAIKLGPVINAINAQARLRLLYSKDPAGSKALLDSLPEKHRGAERAVVGYFLYSFYSGDFEPGMQALRGLTDPWITDFDYTGPVKLLIAELLYVQGKRDLAKVVFAEALTALTNRPTELIRAGNPAWIDAFIAWRLDEKAQAKQRYALFYSAMARPYRPTVQITWVFSAPALCLLFGEREKALALLREASETAATRRAIRNALALDSRMVAFRDDAEITKILAD